MDVSGLRGAFRGLLEVAGRVAGDAVVVPASGEWNGEQILAHVALINAATINVVSEVASGVVSSYDNRLSQDGWTIDRVIGLAGGSPGLMERIRVQGDALCGLGGVLSEDELGTLVPTLLLSNGVVLVDQPVPLRDLITGLAEVEIPGHTAQLLALMPEDPQGV